MGATIASVKRAEPHVSRLPLDGGVDVWRARLDDGESSSEEANRVLSHDEKERAARFHRHVDARRYVTARIVLRRLLGAYLDLDPQAVRFAFGDHGKPRVVPECPGTPRFSVAHSAEAALYAFARGREVGVDLERMRSDLAVLDIARRFFAPEEIHTLCAMAPDRRAEAFFRCWTRKEAYLKARGMGLSGALDAFAVPLDPAAPMGPLWSRLEPQDDAGRWTFSDLDVFPGYAAALVVEGTPPACEMRVWN